LLLLTSLSMLYMVPQLTFVLCVCLYYGCTLFPRQENSQAIPLPKLNSFLLLISSWYEWQLRTSYINVPKQYDYLAIYTVIQTTKFRPQTTRLPRAVLGAHTKRRKTKRRKQNVERVDKTSVRQNVDTSKGRL
jgi:hypothetical protein